MDDMEDEFTPPEPVKGNAWFIVSGLMELMASIFHAFFEFFDTMSSIAAHRYVWEKKQRKFFEEASRGIETITSGGLDATTGQAGPSLRARGPES